MDAPARGFFPRIIGLAAIAVTFWTLIEELRKVEREQTEPKRWKDVVVLMALAVSYAVLLRMFGGFVATVIFLGVSPINICYLVVGAFVGMIVGVIPGFGRQPGLPS
ncbi:MAG: tripartite tricarboxylate transporter TctB family protein [Pseudomonadota bacterium]